MAYRYYHYPHIKVWRAYDAAPIMVDIVGEDGTKLEVYRHKDKAMVRHYLARLAGVTGYHTYIEEIAL
jgi:hypothetical protein